MYCGIYIYMRPKGEPKGATYIYIYIYILRDAPTPVLYHFGYVGAVGDKTSVTSIEIH